MIAPATIADWAMFAGTLGALAALAASLHRWGLQEPLAPERVRSHPMVAPRPGRTRVPS